MPGVRGAEQSPLMVVSLLPFACYHPSFHPVRRWVRCGACGHGFANPRPAPAALGEAFAEPPPANLLGWDYDRLLECSRVVHRLWERRPGGTLLDVGVAHGALAAAAVDYGYGVTGIDLHPGYRDGVERLGVEFLLGDIATHDFGVRRFEVIVMGDVIEHVAHPDRVVAQARRLLAPGGVLWLSTPNHEGAWTRRRRERDAMWMEGEHLQFFSLRSLDRLLSKHGLRRVDYRLSGRYLGCAEAIIVEA